MISRKARLIFLHIPKTGGTSIKEALSPLNDTPVPYGMQHATLDDYRAILSDEEIRTFRKITVVRNSWDRVESGYWYQMRDPTIDLSAYLATRDGGLEAYVAAYAADKLGFQDRWLLYQGQPQNVEVIRFESLAQGFQSLCESLALTCPLDWLNRSDDRPQGLTLSKEAARLVAEIFSNEIQRFSFQMPPLRDGRESDRNEIARSVRAVSDTIFDMSLKSPATAPDFARRAELATSRGSYATAIEDYREALVRDATDPWLHYGLAMAARLNGQLDDALAAIQAALELAPRLSDALQELGAIHSARGNFEQAAAAMEQAVQISPSKGGLHYGMSLVRSQLGDVQGALESARRAVTLEPRLTAAHLHLGYIYLGLRRFDEASASISAAEEIEPTNPTLQAKARAAREQLESGRRPGPQSVLETCPVCGAPDLHLFDKVLSKGGTESQIFACQSCLGLLNVSAYQTREAVGDVEVQRTEFYATRQSHDLEFHKNQISTYQNLLRNLTTNAGCDIQRSSFLDFGCGQGYGAIAAASMCKNSFACDFDLAPITEVLDSLGSDRPANLSLLESLNATQEKFDIVFMWHVLEHIPFPAEFWTRHRAIFQPGTSLFLQVPLFRPEHVVNCHYVFYSERSLIQWASKIGANPIAFFYDVPRSFIAMHAKISA